MPAGADRLGDARESREIAEPDHGANGLRLAADDVAREHALGRILAEVGRHERPGHLPRRAEHERERERRQQARQRRCASSVKPPAASVVHDEIMPSFAPAQASRRRSASGTRRSRSGPARASVEQRELTAHVGRVEATAQHRGATLQRSRRTGCAATPRSRRPSPREGLLDRRRRRAATADRRASSSGIEHVAGDRPPSQPARRPHSTARIGPPSTAVSAAPSARACAIQAPSSVASGIRHLARSSGGTPPAQGTRSTAS